MTLFFKRYRAFLNSIAKAQGYKLKWEYTPQDGINAEVMKFKIVKAPNLKRIK